MNEAKKYTIDILDDHYTIVSDEASEHIAQTAAYVNKLLQEILSYDTSIDQKKAVVLTALRIASNLIHAEQEVRMIHSKGQQLLNAVDGQLCNL